MFERYRAALPLSAQTPIVTLGEGGTPLLHAERLSRRYGRDLWLKLEGANPTGSFKDRGMAVAVSKALEAGARGIVCASTGNTAASAAAYAARAGLVAVVVHPEGAVAGSKLVQVRATGARLIAVPGSFADAFAASLELADREGYTVVNSTNPHRLEGQKTAALELLDQLGSAPDVLALPYGGGGNTAAYAKGFDEAGARPRLLPVEAERRQDTFASAIRITEPVAPRGGGRGRRTFRRERRRGERGRDRRGLAHARARGGRLLRAGVRRLARGRDRARRAGRARRLRPHGPRAEGPGRRRPRRVA